MTMTFLTDEDRLSLLRPLVDDWHTHTTKPRAIVNLPGPEAPGERGMLYSVGIHPWDTETISVDQALSALRRRAETDPAVVAIGEAGIDRLRGATLDTQAHIFREQALIAEVLGKPLIIHCVRAYPEILSIHKEMHPRVAWIFHGFRGNGQTASQILSRPGTFISLNEAYTGPLLGGSIIPPERLLRESD
ncbi:MAG: TatD family hydrolase [Pseudoflavonifractor sp.]|nr:TatD family hydrolase [Alloprevotella sp.]MCM1116914.1 TatD family hydrolase [Pseudoflavonifractor sp.]